MSFPRDQLKCLLFRGASPYPEKIEVHQTQSLTTKSLEKPVLLLTPLDSQRSFSLCSSDTDPRRSQVTFIFLSSQYLSEIAIKLEQWAKGCVNAR